MSNQGIYIACACVGIFGVIALTNLWVNHDKFKGCVVKNPYFMGTQSHKIMRDWFRGNPEGTNGKNKPTNFGFVVVGSVGIGLVLWGLRK